MNKADAMITLLVIIILHLGGIWSALDRILKELRKR